MSQIVELRAMEDDIGNRIIFDGSISNNININFKGTNNTLEIDPECKVSELIINFDCDNAT